MIRFWSGDITTWVNDPCPCGRTYPRLPRGIYGRSDDMVTIRGENVYPSAIEDIIRAQGECGDEYRIIISRERAMDELMVQVEAAPEVKGPDLSELKKKLEGEFKKVLGIRAVVRVTAPNSLERTQFKARRVIDKRELYEEMSRKKVTGDEKVQGSRYQGSRLREKPYTLHPGCYLTLQ